MRVGSACAARSMSRLGLGEPLTIGCPGAMGIWLEQQAGNVEGAASLRHELGEVLGERIEERLAGICLACLDAYGALADGDADTAIGIVTGIIDALLQDGVAVSDVDLHPLPRDRADGVGRSRRRAADRRPPSGHWPKTCRARLRVADADHMAALVARRQGRPDLAAPIARSALDDVPPARVAATGSRGLGCRRRMLGRPRQRLRRAPSARRVDCDRDRRTGGDRCGGTLPARRWSDIARATEELDDRAAEVLAEGAALTLEQAVELAMRAHGTRKRPASGWASLSPTELEVVALVAEGKTNPEIASALTISRATVKTHVSHVLTKLGLGSRSEIAAEFARRGSLG